jgi:multimeric flavodoxin WrbA
VYNNERLLEVQQPFINKGGMVILVVSILGGPRLKGNSNTLLEFMEKSLETQGCVVKRINASKLDIKPCTSCDYCHGEGNCVFKDEMDYVLRLLEDADIVISSSPIFFASVPAQFKILIDRCQSLWAKKYMAGRRHEIKLKKRLGYFIATGGAPSHTIPFNCLRETMDLFYKSINAIYFGEAFVGDLDKIPLEQNSELFKKIQEDTVKIMKDVKNK